MNEKFFERGNLALDWEHVLAIMPDCKRVVVDSYGDAYASGREIVTKDLSNKVWNICFLSSDVLLGAVGEQCPDWQELIFSRPQPPRLPDGFWEAVDIVFGPGYEWAALDYAKETPYAFKFEPVFNNGNHAWAGSSRSEWAVRIPGIGITTAKPSESLTRRPNLEIGKH